MSKVRVYRSIREASDAAIKMEIKNHQDYRNRYMQDPRLPFDPKKTYHLEWVSWTHYLGAQRQEKYQTLSDASSAVVALNIRTMKEYKQRYKEDIRLVSNPNRDYADEWEGHKAFFGTGVKRYETYAEASKAAKRLRISSANEYHRRRTEDPRLCGKPDIIYKKRWKNWQYFLGQPQKKAKYKTLAEARAAVKALGIVSQSQYHKGYKRDKKLPSSPVDYYRSEWISWYDLFVKKRNPYYRTLKEASLAARKLGITSSREYTEKCGVDEKLNRAPSQHYEDWAGWKYFLGTKRETYSNLELASAAAQALGVKTQREYIALYKTDPKLLANPNIKYKDEWAGWNEFLNHYYKYRTLEEASDAACKLNIVSSGDYRKKFRQDPMLYSWPEHAYKKDWTDWDSFLNVAPKYPLNTGWNKAFEMYLAEQKSIDTKRWVIKKFYFSYFESAKPSVCPSQILYKDHKFNSRKYEKFVLAQRDSIQRSVHIIMVGFFDWILEKYCVDEDEDEWLILPGFRNPLKTLLKLFAEALPSVSHLSESNKPVLPLTIVDQARNYLFPETTSGFNEAHHLHRLFSADWHNISVSKLNKSDPDCVWRENPTKKGNFQIWSPVRAIALFTLLRVPLRGQQILWLDSGEADREIPIREKDGSIKWVDNFLPMAGASKVSKGFIAKQDDAEGMYITTNKSSVSDGYHVPYIPPELVELIIKLRDWQAKYNPVKKPTRWLDMKLPTERNRKLLQARGSQIFLFRSPSKNTGEPHTAQQVFGRHLPLVLYEIQAVVDDLAFREEGKIKSKYTPHSLRTSLITAYVVDGGVPISVISKLVGHQSIVMTIYYTKVGHGRMKSEINRAEKIALNRSVDRLQDVILNDSIEKAKGELFSKDGAFLNSIGVDWPRSSYQITDKGICAMGGGGCDKGGLDENGVATDAPVVVGYLGRRNCIRCKYFITGPAFIGGLSALCNEVILETNIVAQKMTRSEELREQLKDEKYDVELSGKVFTQVRELRRSEANYEEVVMQIDVLLADFVSVQSLMKQCKTLLFETASANQKNLIVPGAMLEVDFELEDAGTDFRLLCEICDNATIYSGTSAARAIPLRSQMLDKLALTNGVPPVMFTLSEEEQLAVGNQAASLIQSYVSRWSDIDRLIDGEVSMSDLLLPQEDNSLLDKFKMLVRDQDRTLLEGDII